MTIGTLPETCPFCGGESFWEWRECIDCGSKTKTGKDWSRRAAPDALVEAATAVSVFVREHDYPAIGSQDFNELTRLLDIQDTAVRALRPESGEGAKK